ncbi:MAG TPA: hypothetical protein VFI02_01785 [Armatimonadota bacterium]|nr:hypothetical protein [Armatimonadota bacterium]
MGRYLLVMLTTLILGATARAEELKFKEDFLRRLIADVPTIMKDQDPKTGRFGEGIWTVNDQNSMFPLAVAWATKSDDNPYYRDPKVLKAIVLAGDALIADANDKGQWEFRKKDGSTWGPTYMPWTYYRWLRSFTLIKDGMSPEDRERWEDAVILGYTGISETQLTRLVNIPTYHAMGLYLAGKTFDRPEWRKQAKDFLARVIAAQDPSGFWSENFGPVVRYNSVYIEALGAYYSISGDEMVLPALARAAKFHANLLYPDGSLVETLDERNPYHAGLWFPSSGMTLNPEGRGLVLQQLNVLVKGDKPIATDTMAGYIMDGHEGSTIPTAGAADQRTFMLDDGKAMVRREKPWFVCLSAYHCPIRDSRWIQDRQNLVSIYHDKCGLILGGGNTKLQPLWSNFTVGDVSLLKHAPGDIAPDFKPKGALFHIPTAASIQVTDPIGLALKYGEEDCSIEIEPVDDSTLRIHLKATTRSGLPVAARLTLMPHLGKAVQTENGFDKVLGEEPFAISDAGGWIAHNGWKLTLPKEASVAWPVLPHNPYRKDGSATIGEARLVVSLPFAPGRDQYVLTLSVE